MNPHSERDPHGQISAVMVQIKGRVQGVWYRGWTVENARDLDLDGWVKNRRDGSVQAVFSGSTDKVQEMLRRCADGPPHAQVAEIESVPYTDALQPGFRIER